MSWGETIRSSLPPIQELKPLYFSAPTRMLRRGLGLGISFFKLPTDAAARLEGLYRALPDPYRKLILERKDFLFRSFREGAGVSPITHLRACARLLEIEPNRAIACERTRVPLQIKKRLRLLFVTSHFPSVHHGGGLRISDLIRTLSARHEISLFSRFDLARDESSLARLTPYLKRIRLVSGDRIAPDDFRDFLKREKRFDAIHFAWPDISPLIAIGREYSERCVFEMVEGLTRRWAMDLARIESNQSELASRLLCDFIEAFELESQGVRDSDSAIVVTDTDGDFSRVTFGGDPTCIPTCVSQDEIWDRVRPDAPYRSKSVVFVGFFDHTPNIDGMRWYFENIHPRVLERVPDYSLLLVGAGDTQSLRSYATESNRVSILGRVENLPQAIQAAQVCISPLISGAGIRGKLNQYSACYRPTVTTPIGSSGTPYRDGFDAAIAERPDIFADKLIALLKDPKACKEMALRARATAEAHFSWTSYLDKLEALYAG